ncbi:hypothetical protein FQR65_LT16754 [Abscondita terminalis]|nr:hypothetical protein FQR65_LT16754 [Abscondita terminalis]
MNMPSWTTEEEASFANPGPQKYSDHDYNCLYFQEKGFTVRWTFDKDYAKAFELFTLASETNEGMGYACYIRGQYLEFGYHTDGETDQQEAVRMYEKGAELQEINCIYEMGRCYRYGIVHEQNPDLAVAYFQKAADAGLPKGMVELGQCAMIMNLESVLDCTKTFEL